MRLAVMGSIIMISFAVVRLALEYTVPHPIVQTLFANGTAPYTESIFGIQGIPYWLFPDYFKSKTFLGVFESAWWSFVLMLRRIESLAFKLYLLPTWFTGILEMGYLLYEHWLRFGI